jgi:hypothetical protein
MADAALNRALAAVFENGRGEVGLEVGVDPGLARDEFIRIPKCLKKRWVARSKDGEAAGTGATIAQLAERPGWVSTGDIIVYGGGLYHPGTAPLNDRALDSFRCDRPTYDDILAFVAANSTHVRAANFSERQLQWIHAVRFWSVVSGFVTTSKSSEWVEVDTPTGDMSEWKPFADFIVEQSANSWTAAAARATSWRKSNHATGGDIATGFPRRWMQKNQYWPTNQDKKIADREQRNATSAFYVATHASSVHAVLALMASSDKCHWASINPNYGLIPKWEIRESTAVRMVPKTQVAGAAWVTDAMVCFNMTLKEGIAPLLDAFDQYESLVEQYRIVEQNGVKVASYANWFLNGHPTGVVKMTFNQKDSSCAELIGELGYVATEYYKGTTIGASPALLNATKQAGTPTAQQKWAQLTKAKKQFTGASVVRAYGRIKGASASSRVQAINSDDKKLRDAAVVEYNKLLQEAALATGVTSVAEISAAVVEANSAAADRQAEALSTLAEAVARAPEDET